MMKVGKLGNQAGLTVGGIQSPTSCVRLDGLWTHLALSRLGLFDRRSLSVAQTSYDSVTSNEVEGGYAVSSLRAA